MLFESSRLSSTFTYKIQDVKSTDVAKKKNGKKETHHGNMAACPPRASLSPFSDSPPSAQVNKTTNQPITLKIKMTAQQELEKLQAQIQTRTEETTAYLASLKGKLAEYDEQHKVSETATSYFQTGIAHANASVDELKAFGAKLQAQSKDASAELVESAKGAFDKVGASLEDLRKNGEAYDEKVKASFASAVEGAREGLSGAATSVAGLVDATREKAAAGFEALKDQFAAAQKALSEQASAIADKAEDAKDTVEDKAEDIKDAVEDKAEDIKDTAEHKTEDIKDGSHTLYENATEFVHQAVDYVSETLHNVKVSATEAFAGHSEPAKP